MRLRLVILTAILIAGSVYSISAHEGDTHELLFKTGDQIAAIEGVCLAGSGFGLHASGVPIPIIAAAQMDNTGATTNSDWGNLVSSGAPETIGASLEGVPFVLDTQAIVTFFGG